MAAVPPRDWDRGEGVSAHDGFQGEFDGDVEVGAEDRADAVDDGLPVGLERVCRVIQSVLEHHPHEGVGQTIHEQLERRVVDRAAALHKPASEYAVVSFVELFPIPHDIAAVVGFISHHDDDRVAGHGIEAACDRTAKPVGAGALYWAEDGKSGKRNGESGNAGRFRGGLMRNAARRRRRRKRGILIRDSCAILCIFAASHSRVLRCRK